MVFWILSSRLLPKMCLFKKWIRWRKKEILKKFWFNQCHIPIKLNLLRRKYCISKSFNWFHFYLFCKRAFLFTCKWQLTKYSLVFAFIILLFYCANDQITRSNLHAIYMISFLSKMVFEFLLILFELTVLNNFNYKRFYNCIPYARENKFV